ncbi:CBS domain-containing protein [Gammaproteobacteria bacterium]|nr:CBS domain-containing protein [Gammaproteobacteria bacterium]
MRSLKISDHLIKNPIKVSSKATIGEAARTIIENKVSGVIVVDEHNKVEGMLSELDCLRSLLSEIYNEGQVGKAPVTGEMSTPVTCNKPEDDIISVAENMLDQKQRRRPIIDNGRLAGQITCRQLLSAIMAFG